jgi:2-iminobutanoate/2-iminopropanoate deaminase
LCHHRRRGPDYLCRGTHRPNRRRRQIDAQFKQTFRNIEKTLAEASAKLSDMVTMTVFLIDARFTTRMTELRTELFGKDFPASAAITVQGFAQPEMMIEVQGIAVTA